MARGDDKEKCVAYVCVCVHALMLFSCIGRDYIQKHVGDARGHSVPLVQLGAIGSVGTI